MKRLVFIGLATLSLMAISGCGDATESSDGPKGSESNGDMADVGMSDNNGDDNNGDDNNGGDNNGGDNNGGDSDAGGMTGAEDTGGMVDSGGAVDVGDPMEDAAMEDTAMEDTSTPDTGGEVDTGVDTGQTDAPSLDEVFTTIFQEKGCSAGYCHGGGQGGLTIQDTASAHANLVDVDAVTPLCGLTRRIVPGEPEQSILWMRVRPLALDEGDPCAPKMPANTEGLSAEEAQIVYDWILAGAPE